MPNQPVSGSESRIQSDPKSLPRQILIVYQREETQTSDGSKNIFSAVREQVSEIAVLNISAFSCNLETLCKQLSEVFSTASLELGGYGLETVELSVDVTAKGEVKFIGSVGSEIKGGLKLSFRRNPGL